MVVTYIINQGTYFLTVLTKNMHVVHGWTHFRLNVKYFGV